MRVKWKTGCSGVAGIMALLTTACAQTEPTAPGTIVQAHVRGVSCEAKQPLADRLAFASRSQASQVLRRPNAWSRQLSAFDRGARMRTLEPTTDLEFLQFTASAALDWTTAEKVYWDGLAQRLSDALVGMNLRIPNVSLVKTTGLEEFNGAYTRNDAIIFPRERLSIAGDERWDFFLLAHELFHVLSTANPSVRDPLYALLGFQPFAKFTYPPELEARRLSNPQAHHYEHALAVQTNDGAVNVAPVFQVTVPLEDVLMLPTSGPPAIFQVIDVVLLPVDLASGQVIRDANGALRKYGFGNTNWVQLMARNSNYIVHPEELMADNFALLMEWRSTGVQPTSTPVRSGVPSGFPVNDVDLLLRIEALLTEGCR